MKNMHLIDEKSKKYQWFFCLEWCIIDEWLNKYVGEYLLEG